MRQSINRDRNTVIGDLAEQIKEIENDDSARAQSQTRLQSLYQQIGMQYIEKKLWDMAIESFLNSIKYGKKQPANYYWLGVAYGNRGSENKNSDDIDRAGRYYEKTIELDSAFFEASYALAVLLFFEKNEKEKALSIMEQTAARNNKFYMSRFGLARFYYELQQPEKALGIYRNLDSDLAKLPDSQAIREYRGQCDENIRRIVSEQKK
jgi:tetratricopeptide (TPR) repeat protein